MSDKFIFAADTHFQVTAWSGREDLAGDSLKAGKQIFDLALQHNCDLVLGGDVFDSSRPVSKVFQFVMEQVRRLQEKYLNVYFIQGQHCASNPPWLSLLGCIHLTPDKAYAIGDRMVVGVDYNNADSVKEELGKLDPKADTLILHQMSKPFMGWNLDPDWIPIHIRLTLIGDYHRQIKVPDTTRNVYYPGSICTQSIDEPPDKYVYFVTKGSDEVVPLPLVSRPFASFVVSSEEDLQQAIIRVKEIKGNEIGEPLVVVRSSYDAEKTQRLVREANDKVILMMRALPSADAAREAKAMESDAPTLEECLEVVVSREKDAELYNFTLELLNSTDPRDVIERKATT